MPPHVCDESPAQRVVQAFDLAVAVNEFEHQHSLPTAGSPSQHTSSVKKIRGGGGEGRTRLSTSILVSLAEAHVLAESSGGRSSGGSVPLEDASLGGIRVASEVAPGGVGELVDVHGVVAAAGLGGVADTGHVATVGLDGAGELVGAPAFLACWKKTGSSA